MSDAHATQSSLLDRPVLASGQGHETWADEAARLPVAARYGVTLALVALATLLGFVFSPQVAAPSVALIFVLPVVVAATAFGWGPALAAVAAGVLSFDFFFTEPKYSLAIASPSDIWAAALLAVTASIVSAVAADARRRALDSRRAVEQARALHSVAHAVIEGRPRPEVVQAAATALSAIFRAPAAIFLQHGEVLDLVAMAGDAAIGWAEEDAARGAANATTPMRAESYPFEASMFDLWPVASPDGGRYVLGVDFGHGAADRPSDPERFIEAIGAYLSAARETGPAPDPRTIW
jgi:K+-sensing histidine kinase KdpD